MVPFTRETLRAVDLLMLELIGLQEKKVLNLANRIHPGLSSSRTFAIRTIFPTSLPTRDGTSRTASCPA